MTPLSNEIVEASFPGISVLEQLTPGAQGRTFLVDHERHGRCVLKLVWPEFRERTLREYTALTSISCDRLAKTREFGDCTIDNEEYIFLISDYVEGKDLRAVLAATPSLDAARVSKIARDVCEALEALWARRIVHRDVNPSNIMIEPGGGSVLIDLGVARHLTMADITTTGTTWGKQGYMAPEHAAAQRALTVRADVFSLGVTAYEALVGQHPFLGRQSLIAAQQVPVPPYDRAVCPQPFSILIMSMISFRAALRPLPRQVIDFLGR